MEPLEPVLTPEDALKERIVKVHYFFAKGETKEVSEEEAKRILSDTYSSTMEG